jgi:hypothetical protein
LIASGKGKSERGAGDGKEGGRKGGGMGMGAGAGIGGGIGMTTEEEHEDTEEGRN